ncbi:MAG: NADH-quinone oxidoreductase subunit A [candidate division Zixibacteria bacterium]|nr:NADH-quinone oxidoreductase subunit A [candidate division Zixibacteria bacterium]
MVSDFAAVAVFLIVGVGFVLFTLLLSKIFRPSDPNPIKQSTYECGEEPFGPSWIQFNVRFYIFALMFVIFDVEAIFLFPWAIAYQSLGLFAFVEMLIFISILLFGLAYAWKKGLLKWY